MSSLGVLSVDADRRADWSRSWCTRNEDRTGGLTARALARRIKLGRLTAGEALDAHLERIDQLDPTLNGVVSLDRDLALRQTEAADTVLAHGDDLGPLHGVPMTLKDAHDVAELRTTVAARLRSDRGATRTSPPRSATSSRARSDEDGMPIGIQIVGPLWCEMRLLEIT